MTGGTAISYALSMPRVWLGGAAPAGCLLQAPSLALRVAMASEVDQLQKASAKSTTAACKGKASAGQHQIMKAGASSINGHEYV